MSVVQCNHIDCRLIIQCPNSRLYPPYAPSAPVSFVSTNSFVAGSIVGRIGSEESWNLQLSYLALQ